MDDNLEKNIDSKILKRIHQSHAELKISQDISINLTPLCLQKDVIIHTVEYTSSLRIFTIFFSNNSGLTAIVLSVVLKDY